MNRKFATSAMMVLLSLVQVAPSRAAEWKLVQLDEASVTYKHFADKNYTAYFDGPQKDFAAVTVNSTLARYLFLNTQVHGTSDSGQYRQIGLQFSVGMRLSRYLDIQYQHHSQHLLDTQDAYGRHFPVEDSVGATLYFYRNDNREALIP